MPDETTASPRGRGSRDAQLRSAYDAVVILDENVSGLLRLFSDDGLRLRYDEAANGCGDARLAQVLAAELRRRRLPDAPSVVDVVREVEGFPCSSGYCDFDPMLNVPQFMPEGGGVSVVGFTPRADTDPWTVRRCPLHEIVATEEEYCPVLLDESACGLQLSEPFKVVVAEDGAHA